MVAAFAKAGDVVSYCFRSRGGIPAKDSALWCFVEYEALDPAYHFLIGSNLVDVNYEMERTGSVLGAIAEGGTATKRHGMYLDWQRAQQVPHDIQRLRVDCSALLFDLYDGY